jgi:hypothetical protein
MSLKFGSNINSPLFMSDPVPVRNSKNQNGLATADQSFFVKGDEPAKQESDSYEHLGGEDDVFLINSQGGSFQLHRNTLKETLRELKTQSHVSIRNLSADHTEAFRSVIEALRLLYGSQALYDIVLSDIRAIFSDVKDIKPGTVAASFVGCFNDDKFPGPMGCSPKCAAALPPTEGTPGYYNCEDLVLIYSGGLFSSLNDKLSTHAYIYIGEDDFKGFSQENIRQLREAGIENASLVFGNQDGSYREITGVLTLDQLPAKDSVELTANETQSPTANETSSNTTGAIVIGVIIIVIVLLLLVILYRTYA